MEINYGQESCRLTTYWLLFSSVSTSIQSYLVFFPENNMLLRSSDTKDQVPQINIRIFQLANSPLQRQHCYWIPMKLTCLIGKMFLEGLWDAWLKIRARLINFLKFTAELDCVFIVLWCNAVWNNVMVFYVNWLERWKCVINFIKKLEVLQDTWSSKRSLSYMEANLVFFSCIEEAQSHWSSSLTN